jgi:PAS domain S-box-containing protein
MIAFAFLALVIFIAEAAAAATLLRLRAERNRSVERGLAQSKRLRELDALIESADDAIISGDANTMIESWNPAAERMYGWSAKEMIGQSWKRIVPPGREGEVGWSINKTRRGDHVFYEALRLRKDGRIVPISVGVTPVLDESGRVYKVWGIVRDISEKWRLHDALQTKTKALERSNEELESYAYVASHDLQEPVRKIASFTQLLHGRYAGRLDPEADRLIGIITGSADRMQKMIHDLLDYSRVATSAGAAKRARADQALDEALSMLESRLKEAGAVVARDPLPEVMVDPFQLRQVFLNLISNAVKFRGRDPPRIRVSARSRDGRWEFSVRDNGIGFEQKDAGKLFKMFERLHPRSAYPGTGIGLALCRRIVERHGGRIRAESKPGAGTTFYFDLPVASSIEAASVAGGGR